MGDSQGSDEKDFFVSYTGADQAWAEWVAWELEQVGYTTVLQAWDFVAGSNFADAMDRALKAARHLVPVLSSAYLQSRYGKAEWLNAFIQDPTGEDRRLIPVRVEDCDPQGLLQSVVYIDLVGLDEAAARERLLEKVTGALRGHARPTSRPRFPTTPASRTAVPARPRFPTALPPIWNLPWRRNPDFTGREAQLAGLAAQLDHGATAITQAQAVQGTGGIGKTSLAVEYAYRSHARFEVVWWVRAEEPASLVGDYTALAAALGLPEADQPDQQAAAAAVRSWLDGNGRWLLVLDNAQAPDQPTGLRPPLARVADLVPQVINGQALITTRDARWQRAAELAELDLFTPGEAVLFLLARAASTDTTAASQVAELLGWLPLALEQAGAYTRETGISLASYLQRLRQFPELTLARGEPRDRDPADTVAATWRVSLDRVRPVPGALSLLEVCAFLAPDDIPRDLFTNQVDGQPDELAALAADPFALDQAVAALRRYSLLKASQETLVLHRLLQQVVRSSLDPVLATNRVGLAVELLAKVFPREAIMDVQSWSVCERLLPHVLVAAEHAETNVARLAKTGWLLDRAATYLQGRGRYAESRGLFERAVTAAENSFGLMSRETATRLNNLGLLLIDAGDYAAAKTTLERSLATKEAVLEPNSPSLAATLANLGEVLWRLGEPDAARQHLNRALAIYRASLGTDNVETGIVMTALGWMLMDLGELQAAREHLDRALAIARTNLGPDHPQVAAAESNFGTLLYRLGDLDGARDHLQHALDIAEAVLGHDHPHTQAIAQNLANL